MSFQTVDFLILTSSQEEKSIFENICKTFNYSFACLSTVEELLDSTYDPLLSMLSCQDQNSTYSPFEIMQVARQKFSSSTLCLLLQKSLTKSDTEAIAKLGNKIALTEQELVTAKPSFVINQVLKGTYIPFKQMDLVVDTVVPFNIYHVLPQRKKFLPVLLAGDKFNLKRAERMAHNTEYYFHRLEAAGYQKYISDNTDNTQDGLAKKCRANFLALQAEFIELVFDLSDSSDRASLTQGQQLLGRCRNFCEELMMNLAAYPKAWEIINNSSIGEFGSLERAPAIAAYTGVFGLEADFKKVADLMLLALIIDISIILSPDAFATKLRLEQPLNEEEQSILKSIPSRSLEMVLNRKLGMDEKNRKVFLSVYERADGKGYPEGISELKLGLESQLIRFAKEFDAQTCFKLGKPKKKYKTVVESLLSHQKDQKIFSDKFVELMNNKLFAGNLLKED